MNKLHLATIIACASLFSYRQVMAPNDKERKPHEPFRRKRTCRCCQRRDAYPHPEQKRQLKSEKHAQHKARQREEKKVKEVNDQKKENAKPIAAPLQTTSPTRDPSPIPLPNTADIEPSVEQSRQRPDQLPHTAPIEGGDDNDQRPPSSPLSQLASTAFHLGGLPTLLAATLHNFLPVKQKHLPAKEQPTPSAETNKAKETHKSASGRGIGQLLRLLSWHKKGILRRESSIRRRNQSAQGVMP